MDPYVSKPTSEVNVIIRQADTESGLNNSTIEYGYSTSQEGTYTWQDNQKQIHIQWEVLVLVV